MISYEILTLFFLCSSIILFYWKYNLRIAIYLDLFDDVSQKRKLKKKRTPLTGGLIILSFIYLFFFLKEFDFSILQTAKYQFEVYNYLILTSLLFILGFYDDKHDLSPNLKLITLMLLFSLTFFLDEGLQISILYFKNLEMTINIQSFSIVFIIFCLIVFTNATNMYDGINLQCSSYFLFLVLYIQTIIKIDPFLSILSVGLLFFMVLNIKNKSYLGDSGVYILSFVIGVIIIKLYNQGYLYCDQIFLMMLLPGIDMIRLTFTRIFRGLHPFKADNDHIHHLMGKKFNELQVFIINFSLIIIPNILGYIFSQYILFISITTLLYIFIILKLNGTNKKI